MDYSQKNFSKCHTLCESVFQDIHKEVSGYLLRYRMMKYLEYRLAYSNETFISPDDFQKEARVSVSINQNGCYVELFFNEKTPKRIGTYKFLPYAKIEIRHITEFSILLQNAANNYLRSCNISRITQE